MIIVAKWYGGARNIMGVFFFSGILRRCKLLPGFHRLKARNNHDLFDIEFVISGQRPNALFVSPGRTIGRQAVSARIEAVSSSSLDPNIYGFAYFHFSTTAKSFQSCCVADHGTNDSIGTKSIQWASKHDLYEGSLTNRRSEIFHVSDRTNNVAESASGLMSLSLRQKSLACSLKTLPTRLCGMRTMRDGICYETWELRIKRNSDTFRPMSHACHLALLRGQMSAQRH